MELKNNEIKIKIADHGAELKSAVKNGREYMWCGDPNYWGRTSPVLFPFVGTLKNKSYTHKGKEYPMGQHGFARDCDFVLKEKTEDSVTYVLKSDEETLKIYPFDFTLEIKYTIKGSVITVGWTVINDGNEDMHFSIGAHPAFNLKDGDNYFGFNIVRDISYYLLSNTGLLSKDETYTLENNAHSFISSDMFDRDALIIENKQIKYVTLCDSNKKPYVQVSFNAPLFGLWSPAGKNAPFVCIEPWYGRCDADNFSGELKDREYSNTIAPSEVFKAEYTIELM